MKHLLALRRQRLAEAVGRPIVLLGNSVRPRNLPGFGLNFRQDSTFLYYTGCADPGAAVLIDGDRTALYLPAPGPDDALWHGEVVDLEARRIELGVQVLHPASELAADLERLSAPPATLAIPDGVRTRWLAELLGIDLDFGRAHGDPDLVRAVIAARRSKSPAELEQLRTAARHSTAAHHAVAAAARPGVSERSLAALFRAALDARGCTEGYGTILTRHGEVLHNLHQRETLRIGDLLLVDGGAELPSGYGADLTRTWPVGGRFTPRQRAAYAAVLQAEKDAIGRCVAGVPYREVHDTASLVIARFLADEGLLRCTPQTALETGAHAVFFPHGVGHLLGLDVHDLENFGDLAAYPPGTGHSEQFGTCYLRLNLPLEPGWVVTVEPGFYVVPAILADPHLRERFAAAVDFDRAATWLGFGGIRIEDDVAVTLGAPDLLTTGCAKEIEAVEELAGSGVALSEIFDLPRSS